MNLIVKPRRKPSQSRAWMTSGAIQDAFVLLYKEFGALFRNAFVAASDWPPAFDAERIALNAFAIVDAITKHALLVQDTCPDADELVGDVECAVIGYLESALER